MGHAFDPSILREYDIRGVFGHTLDVEDARAVGRSFATVVGRAGGRKVVVGYDGRLSSPILEDALVEGLTGSGIDVVRVGLGPTPMLYYAEASLEDVDGGVQITGSHNPGNHNGFKFVHRRRPFFGADIAALGALSAAGDWAHGCGAVAGRDVLDAYVERLLEALDGIDRDWLGGLRIAWDAGNGATGEVLEALTARLPGEHHLLFAEIDGRFPHHHPDPTEEKNLADLKAIVAAKNLDFGVAFDGDGDRIGAVDGAGRVIWGDQLLAILAEDVLRDVPGATIIADVKASRLLFDRIAALGGTPLMWKTGHSLIKSKMAEVDAPLAGEMSGHIFFAHRFYGFDDALYAALRLIAASGHLGRSVTALRGAMPALIDTPELRFPVDGSRKFAVIAEVEQRLTAAGADFVAIDGVRVSTPDGWWLLRASNTQDVLTARAESTGEAGLDRLLAQLDDQLERSGVKRDPQVGR